MTKNIFDRVDLGKFDIEIPLDEIRSEHEAWKRFKPPRVTHRKNEVKNQVFCEPRGTRRYEWYDIDLELSKNGIENATKRQVVAIETIANERPLERGRIVGIWNEGDFGYIRIMFEYNGFVINRNGEIAKVDKPELF